MECALHGSRLQFDVCCEHGFWQLILNFDRIFVRFLRVRSKKRIKKLPNKGLTARTEQTLKKLQETGMMERRNAALKKNIPFFLFSNIHTQTGYYKKTNTSFGCKFSELQHDQVLLKLVNK